MPLSTVGGCFEFGREVFAKDLLFKKGFSYKGETKDIFFEMVDKFKSNEGGYYSHSLLTNALKNHETTDNFHKALKKCLEESLKNGELPDGIVDISSHYLGSKGKQPSSLPKFPVTRKSLFDGTVLTVHDIWSMRVYAESLEFKGNQIRGVFRYTIEDHFGLDVKDIDHHYFKSHLDLSVPYEWLDGFRSWYLLQHFEGYGYKPFITKIEFKL